MKEQLISFETAKLAKEKGFFIWSNNRYNIYKNNKLEFSPSLKEKPDKNQIFAPTQSLLQKWLREVHCIHGSPLKEYKNKNTYTYEIVFWIEDIQNSIQMDSYDSYEQALEVGLLAALNLIK